MEYALLDWDNTLRKGYTLFSLIDFFVENNVIDRSVIKIVNDYQKQYANNIISHDDLAKKSCEVFALYLEGKSERYISECIESFVKIDNEMLFPFSSTIFETLNNNGIRPIIVSGAPKDVIKYYYKFGIFEVYAFEAEKHNGIYTGNVLYNYGYDKNEFVKRIIKQTNNVPLLSFGDSISDYDMLKIAKRSIVVSKNHDISFFHADEIITPDMSIEKVKIILQKNILIAKENILLGEQ